MRIGGDEIFDRLTAIATERVTIRRMTMRDVGDIFEYSKDPEVARHVLWDAHRTIGETRSYVRYTLRKYRMGEPASLAICLNATGKVIGTIGFMWYQSDHASAEVGYSLSRDYWNCGLMTEALGALIQFAFTELMLHRIEAQHELQNPASGAVMRKVGMQREGTLRGRLFNKGKYVDVELYAILREDFFANSSKTK
ncbi:GNAT family N-acetyltransferase [Bacillota bacterium Meth-B3]|nr:GNAT family N-acetyltransferase [Christensenellaceae bacterium]MEA5066930.1 GNAT family N-acetyltransferase [Eubacteriales bacterium]